MTKPSARAPFRPETIELIDRTTVFRGYFRVDEFRLRHRRFDGGWSAPINREVFDRGDAIGLLPYDPMRDVVVLIEQIRIGAYAAGLNPWMTEIVAGMIGAGETPEEVARREAVEEIGVPVDDLIPVYAYMPTAGAVSELVYLFCGRVDSSALPATAGRADENEDILVTAVPWAEAVERLTANEFTNGLTITALQWLALNRERLRNLWRTA